MVPPVGGGNSAGPLVSGIPMLDLRSFSVENRNLAAETLCDFIREQRSSGGGGWICVLSPADTEEQQRERGVPTVRKSVKKVLAKQKLEFRKLSSESFMINTSTLRSSSSSGAAVVVPISATAVPISNPPKRNSASSEPSSGTPPGMVRGRRRALNESFSNATSSASSSGGVLSDNKHESPIPTTTTTRRSPVRRERRGISQTMLELARLEHAKQLSVMVASTQKSQKELEEERQLQEVLELSKRESSLHESEIFHSCRRESENLDSSVARGNSCGPEEESEEELIRRAMMLSKHVHEHEQALLKREETTFMEVIDATKKEAENENSEERKRELAEREEHELQEALSQSEQEARQRCLLEDEKEEFFARAIQLSKHTFDHEQALTKVVLQREETSVLEALNASTLDASNCPQLQRAVSAPVTSFASAPATAEEEERMMREALALSMNSS